MQTNLSSRITVAYHFLSEAIIMFLIALPFFYHRFLHVPYWSYLVVIVATCLVFTMITKYSPKYIWYILMAPILFFTFFILDYPTLFATLFSILFVWRYINIRNEELISRENIYILFTLLITAVVSIIVRDSLIMLYPFLQFIVLFIGYITSQLVIVDKDNRKQIDLKLPIYFVGFLAIGAGVFFAIFEAARNLALNIGQGFLNSVGGSIKGFSDFLSFLTVEQRGWPEQTPEEAKHGDGYWNKLEDQNVVEGMSVFLVVGIATLILALVAFYIFILWKKRSKNKSEQVENSNAVSYQGLSSGNNGNSFSKNPFRKYFNKPSNPIRKLVYQFERKAAKQEKGRKASETIEDWFARINVTSNINIYQKVRYGEQHVKEEEIKILKAQLKEIEAKLEI